MPDAPVLTEKPRLKDIVREIVANYAFTVPAVRNYRLRKGRTQNHSVTTEELLDHSFNKQFALLRRAFGDTGLQGKSFLELGPGDSIPLALPILAMGATEYIACDRFPGDLGGPTARSMYQLARQHMPPGMLEGLRTRGLDPETFPWLPNPPGNPPVIRFHAVAAERIHDAIPANSVDAVFSYNVIEHVSDPFATFASAFRVLRPGGVMLHRVDFGPHACWLNYKNPLLFLTISEPVWQAMGSNRGTPNRYRHPEILGALSRAGFTTQVLHTETCDAAFASATHSRLARAKDISLEDLQILNSTLLSTKPA